MADDVELQSVTGTFEAATDEVAGKHHQRVKVDLGGDGLSSPLVRGQLASAASLPAVLSTEQQTILSAIETAVEAVQAAVELLNNTVSGSELQVDIVSSALPTGAATSALQTTGNTALSAIQTAVQAIQTAVELLDNTVVGTELQVDVVSSALPTGAATQATLSSALTELQAIRTAAQILDNTVNGSELQVDVVGALPVGDNNIGNVDLASAIPAGTNLIGDVGIGVRASGGTTPYKNLDVDQTEDQVKATGGQVYWIHAINLTAAVLYLKFYNATAASVTVGTTVPDHTFPVPTLGDTNGMGFVLSVPNGIAFGTAITIAATTGFADNDTGAPAANALIVNLGYA